MKGEENTKGSEMVPLLPEVLSFCLALGALTWALGLGCSPQVLEESLLLSMEPNSPIPHLHPTAPYPLLLDSGPRWEAENAGCGGRVLMGVTLPSTTVTEGLGDIGSGGRGLVGGPRRHGSGG